MRKLGIAIGVIVLIVIVAAIVFAATFDVNKYRGTIQSELQKQLGRQVTLGDMRLGLFPPSLKVKDLAIADDPRFSTAKPFVEANELDVSVKLLPLLRKSVEISSLNLQRPSVELIKNQQGVWNFASLGRPEQAAAPTAPAPPPARGKKQPESKPQAPPTAPSGGAQPPSSSQQQFSLGDLVIRDGQLSLTDLQTSKKPVVYDHIDVTLKNFAPDKPFSIEAAAHLPGAGSQEVRLKGDGGPLQHDNPATTPFDGTLTLKQVEIAGLSKFLNSPALVNTNGIVSGETKIKSQSGSANVQGQTTIANAKIQGTDIPYPIVADYNLTDNLVSNLLTIHQATLKLGPTPINISGTMNSQPTPAQVDLNIKAPNVSLAELAKLAAASGKAFSPGTDVTGTVNANINAKGAADKPALNGTIRASNVQMSGKDIPQPVQVSNVNLNLTPTQIQSNNFNITSGQTTVNALLLLKNYTGANPIVDATLKAPNAQLPALLAMAKAYGVKNVDKLQGQGTLNLDMHAVGPVKSMSSDDIMRAVNGTMNLNFANVKYSGADISHQLGAIAGFLNKSNANDQGFTNILKMTGNILVKNGIAQTNNLQALLDIGNVGVTGTANLVDQALSLRVMAVLSQQFTQKLGGGSGVGGFMQTALANNQGELVIPALVTGTFDHPKFAPDLQQVAQMKLKGLMPNFNNPTQGVGGLLGNLLGAKNTNQNQQQQQQQAQPSPQQGAQKAVQEVLGGLFGKKKQQQQQQQQEQQPQK